MPGGLRSDFSTALTVIRFTLQANGRGSDCAVIVSSHEPALDAASCTAILPHIVSQPKVSGGRIVASVVRMGVRWVGANGSASAVQCAANGGTIPIHAFGYFPASLFADLKPKGGSSASVRLHVSETGVPQGCAILRADTTLDVQRRTCTVAMRLQFLPAVSSDGVPVPATVYRTFRFGGVY